jgi:hypothetical protein
MNRSNPLDFLLGLSLLFHEPLSEPDGPGGRKNLSIENNNNKLHVVWQHQAFFLRGVDEAIYLCVCALVP